METEDGDYMFCFDNTFSTISEKVIFFELILDNMGEDGQDEEDWKKYVTGTDLLDMKLEDILVSIWSFIIFYVRAFGINLNIMQPFCLLHHPGMYSSTKY